MESVSKNTIFGLKMMVKSGLEKTFLKFLHSGDYLILGTIHKRRRNILRGEGGTSQIPMLEIIRRQKLDKSGSKFRHGGEGYQKRPKQF